ncbi:MAG: hypothetical protein P1V20_04740 [Verrucomicrobiales bacterium]|nr:hypothetical protein [Verrucomicrobiales bacterium]
MKIAYHVWFSARSKNDEPELLEAIHHFMAEQIETNYAVGYQLHRFTDKANSESLTDFQCIVNYTSEADQKASMENMKRAFRNKPHATIMRLTGEFRIAFSNQDK